MPEYSVYIYIYTVLVVSLSFSFFFTSLSLVRTGCSLSELLTTYCSRGSLFPLLWLFPIKANSPKPDEQEARAAAAVTTRLLKKKTTKLPGHVQNAPPVNITATPTQKRNLISAAIVFRSLFFLERGRRALNPLSLSAGSGLFVLLYLYSVISVYFDYHPRKRLDSTNFILCV